jgi:hypothetical protein
MPNSSSNLMRGRSRRRSFFFDVYLSPGSWILAGLVGGIIVASLGLFIEFVNPSLKGLNNLRFGADSEFYLWLAGLRPDIPNAYLVGDDVNLVSLGTNLLGPELIAWSLRSNVLILIFNYLILLLSIRMFAEAGNIRPVVLAFLFLANPSVLVSVLTINKEILALLSVALLCKYLASETRSKFLLFLLLVVSFLARWEHCAAVLFFLVITARVNPLRNRRKLQIVILVVLMSIAYPFAPHLAQTFGSESFQGTTVGQLTEVQSHFLYFAVAFPKICLNLFGGIVGLAHLGQTPTDPNNIYSSIIVPWSSFLNLVVASWFFLRRRATLSNDLVFFAVIYLVLFAVTPFVQYRYFLPQYYVMCLEISRRVAPQKYQVIQDSVA